MPFPRRLLCLTAIAALAVGRSHAEKPASPEIVASLENVRVVTSGKVTNLEADFVLTNVGKRTIALAERWNSWGAYQWSVTVKDSTGRVLTFTNPQMGWSRNFLTIQKISPGNRFVTKCVLCSYKEIRNPEEKIARFCFDMNILDQNRKINNYQWMRSLMFPLTISGKFSVREISRIYSPARKVMDGETAIHIPEYRIETNWIGKIVTPPVRLAR